MALRRRLVLLTAATVGVTVVLASVICFVAMRAELRGQVDDALAEQARLGARLAELRGEAGEIPPRLREIPAPSPGEAAGVLQILRADGRVAFGSAEDLRLPVTDGDRAVAAGRAAGTVEDRTVDGVHLRVRTDPVEGGGAVQLARSLESADAALSRLALVLALVCLAGTALAVAVAAAFSRNVLTPVRELTEAAEHVSETVDLSRRIVAEGDDEVGRMARQFNAMLDTLQASRTELASSVAAQRQLVADASHELRTPVTSLRTNIELLLDVPDLDPAERGRMLADVRRQSEDLSSLITDVIELARGDEPLGDTEDVALDELVGEAVARARRHAPDVTFATDLEPVVVHGAPDRLARAVANLLDNAAKHSRPGGLVEVVLGADGALAVRDHGEGVPDAEKAHVFDRFFRGTTSRERTGSGLGLAIVRQTAEAHGGTVAVADAPGGGALFTLALPPAAPAAPAGAPARAAPGSR